MSLKTATMVSSSGMSDEQIRSLIVRSPGRTLDAVCPFADCHTWITSAGSGGKGLERVADQLRLHMVDCFARQPEIDTDQDLTPYVPKPLDQIEGANRTCERCGGAMPNRMSRQRDEKGHLVCDSCSNNAPHQWRSSVLSTPEQQAEMRRREAEALSSIARITREGFPMQRLAHDSGDNALVHHCPFCGSGAVWGRSDGSIECEFCHSVSTVQAQPQQPFMPQTVDGVPSPPPGMPAGQQTELSAPTDPSVAEDDEGVAQDPLGGDQPGAQPGAQPGQPPVPGKKPNPFAKKDPNAAPAPSSEPKGGGDSKKKNVPPWLKGKASAYDQFEADMRQSLSARLSRAFRTSTGATLDQENYLAHLALAFADDRDEVLDSVRVAHTVTAAEDKAPSAPDGWDGAAPKVCDHYEDGGPGGKGTCKNCWWTWGSHDLKAGGPTGHGADSLHPLGSRKQAFETEFACPACNGKGGIHESDDCTLCDGQGKVSWADVERYKEHLRSVDDPRADEELADIERRYAVKKTAEGEAGMVQCHHCGKWHPAYYSHEGQWGQGPIYAVVCDEDGLTDYYTSEVLVPNDPAKSGWGAPSGIALSMRKGAPFAGYDDFDACVRANQDKDDPSAYCGKIKHQVEDGKK